MNKFKVKTMLLTIAAILISSVAVYAQEASSVEEAVFELAKKYEKTDGVTCIVAEKGIGLSMFKTMFRDQFGKDFMKGVKSITVIEYSEASEETCMSLRKEVDVFKSLLEEFDLGDSTNSFARSFATVLEDGSLSDFVIIIEEESSKMFMHMNGKIKVK